MADSPGSPLSSLASDELADDIKLEKDEQSPTTSNMPPSKRRRTGIATYDHHTPISSVHEDIPPPSPTASISSDTSGDIPNSPNTLALIGGGQDDDYSGQANDQVTICRWDGCDAGDLGDMDALVKHIHQEHIGTRQKKYSCEWVDCTRKGQTHASGYALRAHMRSHTREKPFYCTLPECDRSFTRSDALAKHMRTVHETEALRPSDPVSKTHANATQSTLTGAYTVSAPGTGTAASTGTAVPPTKFPRIKLKLSQPKDFDQPTSVENKISNHDDDPDTFPIPEYDAELGFDDHELALPSKQLYRLLRRQIYWAELETAKLQREWKAVEPQRKEAWLAKEAIFDDVVNAETNLYQLLTAVDADTSSPGGDEIDNASGGGAAAVNGHDTPA